MNPDKPRVFVKSWETCGSQLSTNQPIPSLNPHPIQTLSICTSTASKTARHKHCNGIDTASHRSGVNSGYLLNLKGWLDQGLSEFSWIWWCKNERNGRIYEWHLGVFLWWAALLWKNLEGTITLERVREQKQIVFQQKVVVSKKPIVRTGEFQLLLVSLHMVHGTCDSRSPFFQRSNRLLGGSCQLVSGQ